jgi:transposase
MKDPKAALDRTIRSKLRLIAIERHRDGEPVPQIAASFGLSVGTIYGWIRTGISHTQSASALNEVADSPALPPEASFPYKQTLYGMMDCAAPREYGFDTDLWSRFVVCSLLELKFGISLDTVSVDRLLANLGFPVDACIRADLDTELAGTETWDKTQYMLELKKARKEGADLLFWHECASDGIETGVPPSSGAPDPGPDPLSMASQPGQIAWAVNGKGGFWFCTGKGGNPSLATLTHLRSMMQTRVNPCHLIAPRLSMVSDADIRAFAGSTGNRLVLCQPGGTAQRPSQHQRNLDRTLRRSK